MDDFLYKLLGKIEWFYNVVICRYYEAVPRRRTGIVRKSRNQKIIVSLTSYPKRIGTVWLTVETLLRQTEKPDKVILWLAENQFNGMESLPPKLLEQRKRGLTIRFCRDLRSHKKYFYVMQEYPEDLIILADDDIFYPRDTIEKLMKMHKKYPNDICTMTAQVIIPDFETAPSQWRNPELDETFEHSEQIQIFTGSGSLYPPSSISKEAFSEELVIHLCPHADDLWLTFMAYRNQTKITAASPWRAFPVMIYGTGEESLWYINSAEGENDKQWRAIHHYFGGKAG